MVAEVKGHAAQDLNSAAVAIVGVERASLREVARVPALVYRLFQARAPLSSRVVVGGGWWIVPFCPLYMVLGEAYSAYWPLDRQPETLRQLLQLLLAVLESVLMIKLHPVECLGRTRRAGQQLNLGSQHVLVEGRRQRGL